MRLAVLPVLFLLGGCVSLYTRDAPPPQQDHALVHITVPSYAPPDLRTVAEKEIAAVKAAPACLGTITLIEVGIVFGILPWPISEAAIASNAGAAYLGTFCK